MLNGVEVTQVFCMSYVGCTLALFVFFKLGKRKGGN